MEEKKVQQLHDTLSKLRKSAGLGMATQYNFHSSIPMKTSSDGNQIREDGLPNNALYANFRKEGSWDRNSSSAAKYGDGRVIKRNFDDCNDLSDNTVTSTKDSKRKRKGDKLKKKEEKKAAKKAAKLEAKRQARMEEKRKLKNKQKLLARASSTSKKPEKSLLNINEKGVKDDPIEDNIEKKRLRKVKKASKDEKNCNNTEKSILVIKDEPSGKKEKKSKKLKKQKEKKEPKRKKRKRSSDEGMNSESQKKKSKTNPSSKRKKKSKNKD